MDTTEAFVGLRCTDCGVIHDLATVGRCPDCGGLLDAAYDHDRHGAVEFEGSGIERYAPLLPFGREALVSLETGGTPLVEVPDLAADLGVGAVYVKDEGRNTTGSMVDRGLALAVTAAREAGATEVALPTTGNGGQAAAAHAARADLSSTSFAPSRTPFVNKAMINVHGGDMRVVEGRYPDAVDAFDEASEDEDWYPAASFETPYRHEGVKTVAYELAGTVVPDAVVHPTGHGTGIVGLHKGFRDLRKRDRVETSPRLYAAQPAGCAPVAEAWAAGGREADEPTVVEHPDTICGPLEIPDPVGGQQVLEALRATDGGATAVSDDGLLQGAADLASAGLSMSATGGTAVAGARDLAAEGAFDGDETLVLVDPTTANKEEDILRSHLMKQGI